MKVFKCAKSGVPRAPSFCPEGSDSPIAAASSAARVAKAGKGEARTGSSSPLLFLSATETAAELQHNSPLAAPTCRGSSRTITSAYRNPVRNASLGGAPDSRHLYGDAADLQTDGTSSNWTTMYDDAYTAGADYREPSTQSGYGHVRADWRYHDIGVYSQ